MATVQPSSILRARDEDREREEAAFVRDLSVAGGTIASAAAVSARSKRTA